MDKRVLFFLKKLERTPGPLQQPAERLSDVFRGELRQAIAEGRTNEDFVAAHLPVTDLTPDIIRQFQHAWETEKLLWGEKTPRVERFLEERRELDHRALREQARHVYERTQAKDEILTAKEKESSPTHAMLERVLERLIKSYGFKRSVQIELIKSDKVNAFIANVADVENRQHDDIPLRVYVYAGLITKFYEIFLKRGKVLAEEHIEAVVGHELRHLLQSHLHPTGEGFIAERQDTQRREYDADLSSAEAMDRANDNPEAVQEAFEALLELGDGGVALLTSHPATENRMTMLAEHSSRPDTVFVARDRPMRPLDPKIIKECQRHARLELRKQIREAKSLKDFEKIHEKLSSDSEATLTDLNLFLDAFAPYAERRIAVASACRLYDEGRGPYRLLLSLANEFAATGSIDTPGRWHVLAHWHHTFAEVRRGGVESLTGRLPTGRQEAGAFDAFELSKTEPRIALRKDGRVYADLVDDAQIETVERVLFDLMDFPEAPSDKRTFRSMKELMDFSNPTAAAFWNKFKPTYKDVDPPDRREELEQWVIEQTAEDLQSRGLYFSEYFINKVRRERGLPEIPLTLETTPSCTRALNLVPHEGKDRAGKKTNFELLMGNVADWGSQLVARELSPERLQKRYGRPIHVTDGTQDLLVRRLVLQRLYPDLEDPHSPRPLSAHDDAERVASYRQLPEIDSLLPGFAAWDQGRMKGDLHEAIEVTDSIQDTMEDPKEIVSELNRILKEEAKNYRAGEGFSGKWEHKARYEKKSKLIQKLREALLPSKGNRVIEIDEEWARALGIPTEVVSGGERMDAPAGSTDLQEMFSEWILSRYMLSPEDMRRFESERGNNQRRCLRRLTNAWFEEMGLQERDQTEYIGSPEDATYVLDRMWDEHSGNNVQTFLAILNAAVLSRVPNYHEVHGVTKKMQELQVHSWSTGAGTHHSGGSAWEEYWQSSFRPALARLPEAVRNHPLVQCALLLPMDGYNSPLLCRLACGQMLSLGQVGYLQNPEDIRRLKKMYAIMAPTRDAIWSAAKPDEARAFREAINEKEWLYDNPLCETEEERISFSITDRILNNAEIDKVLMPEYNSYDLKLVRQNRFFGFYQDPVSVMNEVRKCKLYSQDKEIYWEHSDLHPFIISFTKEYLATWQMHNAPSNDKEILGYAKNNWGNILETMQRANGSEYLRSQQRIEGIYERSLERTFQVMQRAIESPNVVACIEKLQPGVYRDMMMFTAERAHKPSLKDGAAYLNGMSNEVPDAAKRNKAHWRILSEDRRAHQPLTQKDRERVLAAWEKNDDPSRGQIYLFEHSSFDKTKDLDNEYRVRIVGSHADELTSQILIEDSASIEEYEQQVSSMLREPSTLRDFFLENALHARLWTALQSLRGKGRGLQETSVSLQDRRIDLAEHFKPQYQSHLPLKNALFTTYRLVRVQGMERLPSILSRDEKRILSQVLHTAITGMTDVGREVYERLLVELDLDELDASYEHAFHERLPPVAEPSLEDRKEASSGALDVLLKEVEERFPVPTLFRDDLLKRITLHRAVTPEDCTRVQAKLYTFIQRQPELDAQNERTKHRSAFGGTEVMKEVVHSKNVEERKKWVLWLFGGEVPDDLFNQGFNCQFNPNHDRDHFWALSGEERKDILFHALLGKEGLFMSEASPKNEKTFEEFLEEYFELVFEPLVQDKPELAHKLRAIFVEAFRQFSVTRRIELFAAIVDQTRELRMKGEKMNLGAAMRIFLGQGGLTTMKIGQQAYEQQLTKDPEILDALSNLLDNEDPLPKTAVFTILQHADLLSEGEVANDQGTSIAQVEECLGHASVKQTHRCVLDTGKVVAAKIARPGLARTFQKDMAALRNMKKSLRIKGVDIPDGFLEQTEHACEQEIDFRHEESAQAAVRKNLEQRYERAVIDLAELELQLPIVVPEIYAMKRLGEGKVEEVQVMVEEYVPGLSLKGVESFQALVEKERQGSMTLAEGEKLDGLRKRILEMYGVHAPQVEQSYQKLRTDNLRAQIALEFLTQVTEDGVFHADLHSGNIIVNLDPLKPSIGFIDWGSAGDVSGSTERSLASGFSEFVTELALIAKGQRHVSRLAEMISGWVSAPTESVETWTAHLERLLETRQGVSEFFKGLFLEVVGIPNVTIHPQFRIFLKGLASAGSHLEKINTTALSSSQSAMVKGFALLQRNPGLQALVA